MVKSQIQSFIHLLDVFYFSIFEIPIKTLMNMVKDKHSKIGQNHRKPNLQKGHIGFWDHGGTVQENVIFELPLLLRFQNLLEIRMAQVIFSVILDMVIEHARIAVANILFQFFLRLYRGFDPLCDLCIPIQKPFYWIIYL